MFINMCSEHIKACMCMHTNALTAKRNNSSCTFKSGDNAYVAGIHAFVSNTRLDVCIHVHECKSWEFKVEGTTHTCVCARMTKLCFASIDIKTLAEIYFEQASWCSCEQVLTGCAVPL